MPRDASDVRELIAGLVAKTKLAPLGDEPGLVLDRDGWRLYTKTGLSGDGVTLDGDVVLVGPDGTIFNANWDVHADRAAHVEFLPGPHLHMQFYLDRGVHTWDELAAAISPMIPAVARHYASQAPSNPSLERP